MLMPKLSIIKNEVSSFGFVVIAYASKGYVLTMVHPTLMLVLGYTFIAAKRALLHGHCHQKALVGSRADVLVVSGTCTEVMAPLLGRLHADLGDVRVVSFGACAALMGSAPMVDPALAACFKAAHPEW